MQLRISTGKNGNNNNSSSSCQIQKFKFENTYDENNNTLGDEEIPFKEAKQYISLNTHMNEDNPTL